MAAPQDGLQPRVEQTLEHLRHMESQLRATHADVQSLPFLARGLVERDISSSTGRNLAEWAAASERLYQALAPLASDPSREAGSVGALIRDELPRLAALRAYLRKAPDKVNMVPAAMLKPQQRAEFLDHVRGQVTELQALEGELRLIADQLGATG